MSPLPVSDKSKMAALFWKRGLACALITLCFSFSLRMVEWPSWQNPEYRLGEEWLLATHDAYHWVAGAEGFGLAAGHPMSAMLAGMADALRTSPAIVAFWFPAVLSTFVALIVFVWVWALGSMEAGIAAALLTSISPGFLARTLLGFYDTDLVTLFFPLLMTLAPACWVMRHMLLPQTLIRRWAVTTGLAEDFAVIGGKPYFDRLGNPLCWQWILLLGASGLISWWTQAWHSVFPYLIRYNTALLGGMALVMAPHGRRALLLLGGLAYALPALAGWSGLSFSLALLLCGYMRRRGGMRLLCSPAVLGVLWTLVVGLAVHGDIFISVVNHFNAYLKHSGDVKSTAPGVSLTFPSVAQSIIEVQDLSFIAILSYFHPWVEAAILGLAGFFVVLYRCPGALFLLPLAVLAVLSTKLGGRMVMFGAPIVAIGLTLPLYWILRRCIAERMSPAAVGILCSVIAVAFLVAPFLSMIPAMSQGPMINRRHAEALTRARTMTPEDARLWLWWDLGYAAHHFARRTAIADGAQHAGPSLYLPAAVFATDNPRFARQLIRYTAQKGNEPGNVFSGLDGEGAQALMDRLRSAETSLVEGEGRLFLVVSFEMLKLGFWISNFGNWDFVRRRGEGCAISIVPQALAYKLDSGEVRLDGGTRTIDAASISVFDETGVTCRNYVQEWFNSHQKATPAEQREFLARRRNVHFLFNRVTDEKLALDEGLFNSLMVQLLISDAQDPRFSPYFRLIYDNVFARIYEVL